MDQVQHEFDEADKARKAIAGASDDREALVHAFDGLANLMLTVLHELREIKEDRRDNA